tara:strand:+ start:2963 stop:4243 length:1281 start_codon:yes stop_codon:yes gene_type:complete
MFDLEKAKIAIIGLGYVGLPLAVEFSKKIFTIGFDIDERRISELEKGYDRTFEIEDNVLSSDKVNLKYSSNIQDTKDCNIYIITVPTPIDDANQPDLEPLIKSSRTVGSVLGKNDVVIYESTVYPGVTEEICVPELEKSSGMKYNKDFFCGYSPERVNPGDKNHTIASIVKVTAGSTPEVAQYVDDLYNQIVVAGTHPASSIKVAEASKVIENTQRDVNIALINELALIFNQMGIDTNEVIDAAATKWNFNKLVPGLVGGHCIGVDPYYLTYKAQELGYQPNIILSSRQINNGMSKYIANQTVKEMIKAGKAIKNSNILILGLAFKEDCPDIRNSKVVDIINELKNCGANINIYDPWVNLSQESELYSNFLTNNPLDSDKRYDAIVVAVAHKQFKSYNSKNYKKMLDGDGVIIDIKNIVDNPTWRL